MSILKRLGAIRDHLDSFELPEPWSVMACQDWMSGREQVTVHLNSGLLPKVARVLLAWADTLDDVRGELWRTPDGDSVHLSLFGRLPGGVTVRVFEGVGHDEGPFEAEPDQRRDLSLAVLREWASLDQGVAA